ncbi:hypothetical protein [Nocardia asteroides]|uniref:hypothetical protein n=1 Tax=Nocardia asteroides TaxID=1824 RepID=UPI00343F7C40
MTDSYTITISDSDTGLPALIATIEISNSTARISEIRVELDGVEIHESLTQIDFPLLIHTIRMLSGKLHSATRPTATGFKDAETLRPVAGPQEAPNRMRQPLKKTKDTERKTNEVPPDFGVYYWRLGSIAKVAKHYNVPHHVAQHWIRSLQERGQLANPWPAKKSRPLRPK